VVTEAFEKASDNGNNGFEWAAKSPIDQMRMMEERVGFEPQTSYFQWNRAMRHLHSNQKSAKDVSGQVGTVNRLR
jgi:hypothetical protein